MEANQEKTRGRAVVAIDIGTTKVCAIVANKNEFGKLEVLGMGVAPCDGVLRGVISNIEKTVNAISEAVQIAQRQSGLIFNDVQVGIAGQHIRCFPYKGVITRDNDHTEISRKDTDRLITDMHKLVLPPGDKILHVFPQDYTVDNESGIVDPIGMSGVRLEANFLIVTGQTNASNNISRCIQRSNLRLSNVVLEPVASAAAVLNEEEMEAGVALVDIGGGTTDITIFKDGIIRHTAVIPMGGSIITKDIKEGCNVLETNAEKLKIRYGSALASAVYDNRIIAISGLRGRDTKEIAEKNLARIIQARMEDIFDLVSWEIRKSGFERRLIGGIVLTGGGAQLRDIDKLAELHTGYSCRIGQPIEQLGHGYHEKLANPMFSTAIGLIIKGFEEIEKGGLIEQPTAPRAAEMQPSEVAPAAVEEVEEHETSGKWYEQLFRKTREWFEADPDAEFK